MSVAEQQVAELLSLMPGGVLIFDTSFDDGCLIWVKPSGEVISTTFDSSTRASEGLVETLETWMTTKDLQTLTGLVLGLGPGSFTGVRVAAATAKGLAAAGDIQIFGLSSLRWLEKSHRVSRRTAVVIDAR
ncbi:MAG: tRNA (adenosine(37)-N6)-threonylcarbamoyltransferase complex dimerization subunit type 1 TsaB, partial [Myxococcota bacterium]|nr:tRNA (adenosine(37)-N6)-threonylcarbamoyltransferase complex dimerization subunit type 1 TsaB [Myxococcota bacterium]